MSTPISSGNEQKYVLMSVLIHFIPANDYGCESLIYQHGKHLSHAANHPNMKPIIHRLLREPRSRVGDCKVGVKKSAGRAEMGESSTNARGTVARLSYRATQTFLHPFEIIYSLSAKRQNLPYLVRLRCLRKVILIQKNVHLSKNFQLERYGCSISINHS
ncbi:hypothetical protein RF11_03503 [Thelohanellus kitauei]|uniref:Uncharacterized protein n=1 Tax=Thelohanellus kitauei TaxID=669202 RepID=A0A0C2N1P0_THEKT|nr:hypothetical protein RF11_03503 [Thelohanellus kitauei]